MQLPSAFLNFLAITNGVIINIGMVMVMNIVCSCVIATVKAIPLAVPTKIEMNVPAHVGQAINNPVAAPIVLNPLPFLEIENALTAMAVFSPTK